MRSQSVRAFTRIPFAMRGRVNQADVQRTAIKVSMTAFFDAPRQFDFVFRHGRPVSSSLFRRSSALFLRRVDRNFMGRISSLTPDAVSGAPDDSTRLCVRSPPPPPSVLFISSSFAAYHLFARAIVTCRRIARISRRVYRSSLGGKWSKISGKTDQIRRVFIAG